GPRPPGRGAAAEPGRRRGAPPLQRGGGPPAGLVAQPGQGRERPRRRRAAAAGPGRTAGPGPAGAWRPGGGRPGPGRPRPRAGPPAVALRREAAGPRRALPPLLDLMRFCLDADDAAAARELLAIAAEPIERLPAGEKALWLAWAAGVAERGGDSAAAARSLQEA